MQSSMNPLRLQTNPRILTTRSTEMNESITVTTIYSTRISQLRKLELLGVVSNGEVDNAIYGNEVKNNLYSVYSQPSNVTGKTVQATEIDGQDSFGNGQATDRLLRGPSWNGKPKVDQSPYAVLNGPLDYDVPNAVLNPTGELFSKPLAQEPRLLVMMIITCDV